MTKPAKSFAFPSNLSRLTRPPCISRVSRVCLETGMKQQQKKKISVTKGGAGDRARKLQSSRGGFVPAHTNVNSSVRGGGQRVGEWRSATLGAFRGQGGGGEKGGPYETFQWSFITMGWWFTFIRPAAKSLVCI